ncbi:hypothetical protein [Sphingomonas kyeonggiensis]|uniref:Lon protease-like protein n=1 Tax=Sphingomonas kyeonggiensis TaxID=1268553 RepID=A0A7W6NVM4_9SPHN|nr:hypothetical protein [Sphingomonas kyeonggiensis]MBB4097627.1 Lon protease-like protein [Sphingomonas kyeonggiensis]
MRAVAEQAKLWIGPVLKLLEAVSYVAAVVALFLLWKQLSDDASTKRAENALNYIEQFNTGEVSKSRQNLNRVWLPYAADIDRINAADGLRDQQADQFISKAIAAYDEKNPNEPATLSVGEISSFYDQVQTCIEVAACDATILQAALKASATDFHKTYASTISVMRRTMSPEIGRGLERFIASSPKK